MPRRGPRCAQSHATSHPVLAERVRHILSRWNSSTARSAPLGDRQRDVDVGPLRVAVFRWLWLASLVSNVGAWMQTVGAQWLLVHAANAAILVSLVQTADMLPDVLFAIVGGVLADILDRRRLIISVQTRSRGRRRTADRVHHRGTYLAGAAADVHVHHRFRFGLHHAGVSVTRARARAARRRPLGRAAQLHQRQHRTRGRSGESPAS